MVGTLISYVKRMSDRAILIIIITMMLSENITIKKYNSMSTKKL